MTQNLFVYGTLLPWATGELGAAQRARLSQEATTLGPAVTLGVLFDLGSYPGMLVGDGAVHGAVYALTDPGFTLTWLDAYEGIAGTAYDDYRRVEQSVRLDDGRELPAHVYVYVLPVDPRRAIASGRWHLTP